MLGASSELASVMEFGFYHTRIHQTLIRLQSWAMNSMKWGQSSRTGILYNITCTVHGIGRNRITGHGSLLKVLRPTRHKIGHFGDVLPSILTEETNLTWITKRKPQAGRRKGRKNVVFCPCWPWPLTFVLDLQTRPSDWPNTSSMWIWRKSVHRFPRYFIHKQKNADGAKNRIFRSSLLAVNRQAKTQNAKPKQTHTN